MQLLRFLPLLLLRRLKGSKSVSGSRKKLADLFLNGKLPELIALAVARPRGGRKRRRKRAPNLLDRVSKLVSQGRLSAACTALQERELAAPSDEVINEITAKFPARKEALPPADPSAEPSHPAPLTEDDIEKVASLLPRHTGTGPSGAPMTLWTNSFREANRSSDDRAYITAFTWFTNQVVSGADWTGDYFREVRLVAIKQPSGRHRPIQIAETLDRFIGKVLLAQFVDTLRAHFGELQSVVAEAGADKVIHHVRSLLSLPDSSILVLDFANAFNEVSRAAIRRELSEHFPTLLPFFDLRYRDATTVRFGDCTIECNEGVRQGDPWGAVFFALALHPVLEQMQEKYIDHVTIRAYADDVNNIALGTRLPWGQYLLDFTSLAERIGMKIRISKSALYSHHEEAAELLDAQALRMIQELDVYDPGSALALIPRDDGVLVLGAPVGSDEYVRRKSKALIEDINQEMQLLRKIESMPQEYFLLLQKCFNTRALHLARWVPPDLLANAAELHDAHVDTMWSRLVCGLPSTAGAIRDSLRSRTIAWTRLPCKYGGSGLTSLYAIRPSAYAASVARAWFSFGTTTTICRNALISSVASSVLSLAARVLPVANNSAEFPTDQVEATHHARFRTFKRAFSWAQPTIPEDPDAAAELFTSFAEGPGSAPGAQRTLTSIIHSRSHDDVLSDFFKPSMSTDDLATAAHFQSASCSDAASWMQCVPSEAEFVIPAEEYRWLLAHHFRLPVPNRELLGDKCTDGRHTLDNLGHHLFTCASHRVIPHDNTRDRLHEFCAQAGLKPIREPRNLLRDRVTDTACERRPDIALPGVDSQGRLLLLDVTTTDVGCTTALKTHKSVSERCGAARGAEAAKRGVYENLVDPNSQSFMPLAFEMQGRWGPSAERLFGMVKSIALEKRELQGLRHSFWAGFWRRTISVGFQRDIARSALNIQSQLLAVHDLPRRSYRRHFLDLGRV